MNEYLGLLWCVGEVDDDVDGLDDAAGGVDGDEETLVGLEKSIVDPQHRAKERHHVRDRLEPLSQTCSGRSGRTSACMHHC